MSSDPRDELKNKSTSTGSSDQENLEFDFFGKSNARKSTFVPSDTTSVESEKTASASTSPKKTSPTAPSHVSTISTAPASTVSTDSNTNPSRKNMSNSSFSQYQQNVQRQSREQRAVGSLLSGVAIALISGIILVAVLASFGGYVLWRQIQNQSVTVATLDSKMTKEVDTLKNSLRETISVVDALNAQGQLQKQQISGLLSQIEQMRKDRTTLSAKVQKVESRLSEMERERKSWSSR